MVYMQYIPPVVLMIITIGACLGGETIKRYWGKRVSGGTTGLYFYSSLLSFVAALAVWVLSGFDVSISWFTLGMGILFGVVTMLTLVTGTAAIGIGPWAYTTVIVSLSTIIPTLSGAIFWEEKIGLLQIFGILLMIVCFVLSVKTEQNTEKKATLKWFLLTVLASICTGTIGVLQKVHQSSTHSGELTMFLVIAFAFSAVCAGCFAIIGVKKKGVGDMVSKENPLKPLWIALLLVGTGLASALNNVINLYLSGVMESAMLFPVLNGGNLILITALSVLLYKEKLSKKQWVGLLCGSVAVILLCL